MRAQEHGEEVLAELSKVVQGNTRQSRGWGLVHWDNGCLAKRVPRLVNEDYSRARLKALDNAMQLLLIAVAAGKATFTLYQEKWLEQRPCYTVAQRNQTLIRRFAHDSHRVRLLRAS